MKIKALKNMLKGGFLRVKGFTLNDSILIISSPRGGSTWLAEIFNAIPNTILNWEPFHPEFGILPKSFKGGDALFIPEDQKSKRIKNLIEDVLKFRIYSNFTLSFVALNQILRSKQVITKSVRTTCLIPWIVKHLDLSRKPIYLLRHPIATSFSHLKAFGKKEESIVHFEVPEVINNERFVEHKQYLNGLQSMIERQVALWCINNMPVITHPEHGKKWVVAYYENLLLDPVKETNGLFNTQGIKVDIELVQNINFRKPSQTDLQQDLEMQTKKQLEKWQDWLTKEEKISIQSIFDYFGLKVYSAYSALPIFINNNTSEYVSLTDKQPID